MSGYKAEQEEFWAGQFGDDYTERNLLPDVELSAVEINPLFKAGEYVRGKE